MNFLCIYLGEKGGGLLMHVYVWEHIVSLYYRTAGCLQNLVGMKCSLSLTKVVVLLARSVQGRIQGRAKIGHRGSLSSTIFFFRLEGYSNKLNT